MLNGTSETRMISLSLYLLCTSSRCLRQSPHISSIILLTSFHEKRSRFQLPSKFLFQFLLIKFKALMDHVPYDVVKLASLHLINELLLTFPRLFQHQLAIDVVEVLEVEQIEIDLYLMFLIITKLVGGVCQMEDSILWNPFKFCVLIKFPDKVSVYRFE